jgi:hypothetical protein
LNWKSYYGKRWLKFLRTKVTKGVLMITVAIANAKTVLKETISAGAIIATT